MFSPYAPSWVRAFGHRRWRSHSAVKPSWHPPWVMIRSTWSGAEGQTVVAVMGWHPIAVVYSAVEEPFGGRCARDYRRGLCGSGCTGPREARCLTPSTPRGSISARARITLAAFRSRSAVWPHRHRNVRSERARRLVLVTPHSPHVIVVP